MPSFKSFSVLLLLASLAASAPTLNVRDVSAPATSPAAGDNTRQQNGILAQEKNAQFSKIKKTDACTSDLPMACIDGDFAQCVGEKWVVTSCPPTTKCFSLPLINSKGQSIACTLPDDAALRFKDAGVTGGPTGAVNNTDQTANGPDDDCDDGNDSTVVNPDDDCDDGDDTNANPADDPDCDDDDSGANNTATPTPRTVIRATPSSVAPVQATSSAAGGDYGYGGGMYRRQLQISTAPIDTTPSPTIVLASSSSPSPTDVVVLPASSTILPASSTSLQASSSVITQAPTDTPTSTTSDGISTPTVVIGLDGIVTVTLVSTVTVTPTNCPILPNSSATAIGISSAVPTPSLPVSSVTSAGLPSASAPSVALPSSTFTLASPTSSIVAPVVTPTLSGLDNFSELLTANTTPTAVPY